MIWKRALLSWMTLLALVFASAGASARSDVSPKPHVGGIDLAAALCIGTSGLASVEERLGNRILSTTETSDVPHAARGGRAVIGGLDDISRLSLGPNGLSKMRQLVVNDKFWSSLSKAEQWALNKKWLDVGVKAREEFILAGRNYGPGTVREINYLIKSGYEAVRNRAGDIIKLVPGP